MFIFFTAVNLAIPTCFGPKKFWNKGFGLATKKISWDVTKPTLPSRE